MKTQTVRLIDVFFLGPAMIYMARLPGAPVWLRYTMTWAGVATVAYNLDNYLHRSSKQ